MGLSGLFGLLLLLLTVIANEIHAKEAYGRNVISQEEGVEIEKRIKRLEALSVKTVKSIIGDNYYCIDIGKQPSLDNPVLKNHKIQMQPSRDMQPPRDGRNSPDLITVDCPEGTIPIPKLSKNDLIKAKLFAKAYTTNNHPMVIAAPDEHFAVMRSKSNSDKILTGIGANVTVHDLNVEPDQYSSTQIRLERGSKSIQTGALISPSLYGSKDPRTFVYWKTSNHGCFNLLCDGFVQVHKNVVIGCGFNGSSKIGEQFMATEFRIEKDPQTGNWWIINGISEFHVGYLPAGLLPDLDKGGASYYHWGGSVKGLKNGPSPPMGSGLSHPIEYTHVAYVCGLRVADQSNSWGFPDMNQVEAYTDSPSCYVLRYAGDIGRPFGHFFFYGGPGGNCRI